ncbi:hypothetical protein DFQ30_004371 [Apophysomyces sp. BC1015]|nr:hypothetical protein DFQ30_004371 [Apophysomyces sp. BC1015]
MKEYMAIGGVRRIGMSHVHVYEAIRDRDAVTINRYLLDDETGRVEGILRSVDGLGLEPMGALSLHGGNDHRGENQARLGGNHGKHQHCGEHSERVFVQEARLARVIENVPGLPRYDSYAGALHTHVPHQSTGGYSLAHEPVYGPEMGYGREEALCFHWRMGSISSPYFEDG